MRLKQLLLFTLLLVLVRSIKYNSDYKCQHDGYSAPDGTCHCTDNYGTSRDCSQIQCVNTGVLSPYDRDFDTDQRCSCPPGFLGLHCEPVQCVDGDVKSFDVVGHARDVSVIITYNVEFQEQFASKDKGPDVSETICKAVLATLGVDKDSRVHFYMIETDVLVDLTSVDTCKNDFQNALKFGCDKKEGSTKYNCEGDLTTSYIMGALNQMGEDSRMLIISNLGIKDYDNEEGIEKIRQKAISMRIQMHSLVISPRQPQDNIIYFTTGFQMLRELSESTLGFFINPFDASGGQKLDKDGITEILTKMMPVFFDYVVVDRVVTTTTSCQQPTDYIVFKDLAETESDFWLTVISNKDKYTNYDTGFIGGPGAPNKTVSAGYFNAYTLTAHTGDVMTFKPFSTFGTSNKKCVPSTVLVLVRSGHLARFAISNEEGKDATSPYAISGVKNTLVGHFTKHYHEENLDQLHLEFISSGDDEFDQSKLLPVPSPRPCQYNANFGEISCKDGDDTFIRVRDTTSGAAVTVQNLYCSPKGNEQVSSPQMLNLAQDLPIPAASAACEPKPIIVKETGRSLIISAHATFTISTLFNGNKDSAIRYLNDLDDTGIYDQYILNVYNGDQTTAAKVVEDDPTDPGSGYAIFKQNLMNAWHKYTKNETAPVGSNYRAFEAVEVDVAAIPSTTTEDPSSTSEQPNEPEEPEEPTSTAEPEEIIYFDEECVADVSAVYPLEDLTDKFTNARPNSDVIFIYDRAINITEEDLRGVLKNAYTRRLRLVVLLLGCESVDFSNSDALKTWHSIASQTGGFAVHFEFPSDLNKFLESYVDWVKGQAAASIDHKETGMDFTFDSVVSTPFRVKKDGKYTILVNSVPAVVTVTLSNGDPIVQSPLLGNSLNKFDYTATADDTVTVTAKPGMYFFYASIRVLDLNDDYATIGFAKTEKDPCLEREYPDFNPHEAQFPLTVGGETAVSVNMTLFDSNGTPFRSGTTEQNNANFELNYNWRCSDNEHIFYVSADVTTSDDTSFTRLFTTQCVGESDGKACINGQHAEGNKDMCVCPHDFTGDFCEIPVCQNGGTVTAALECDCIPDVYSGAFCEIYDGCNKDEAFNADFKSIASTIIFVVERSEDVVTKMNEIKAETFANARAAQYIVVQYGNSSEADVIISTTDKASLVTVLKGITSIAVQVDEVGDASSTPTPDYYFDAIPAIAAALNAQVTGSAQIFWFAQTDYAYGFAEDLFDAISHQRVSITALFTESVIDTPIHPVQVAGGSVFYYPSTASTESYASFFTNYIAELLQFQSSFEYRPNVLSSSTDCNKVHTVSIDQSTQKLFVAAYGQATITISNSANLASTVQIPGGTVFTYKKQSKVYIGAGTVTINITGQAKDTYCSSTVTAFSQNQIGYGFVKDDSDTNTKVTTGKGEHLLVTYWTSESVDDTPTPTAVVTPITVDEGFGNSTEVYTTVRSSCSYSLSVPIDCAEGVDAIGVTVSNWVIPNGGGNAFKVDKFISVLCPAGECMHGNTTDSGCDCDPFWGGDYCTEGLCTNGEVVGDICACYTGYSGEYCDERIAPEDRAGVSFLFIQDVCGNDDDLKDSTESVLSNYRALLSDVDKFYLGTNNPDLSDVKLVPTSADLTNQMNANKAAAVTCNTPTIGATLDSYYLLLRQPSSLSSFMLNAASDPSVGKANVAHVTTVGVDSSAGSYFDKLKSDFNLTMEFVGITEKNEYFPSPNGFEDFPGAFTETYDPEIAMLELVNSFGSDKPASTPSPGNFPRCIQDLQAAFVFHTDISSVSRMTEFRTKTSNVIKSVTNYFNIPDVKVIDMDDDTCEFNTTQEQDKTLFYGSIYADASGIGVPTFCSSNMNSYPDTIKTANYKQADKVTLQSVVDSYTKWYTTDIKMKCHCFDYANPNTTSIILWTPLSATSLDKGAVSFAGFEPGKFQHIVMPFGFTYADSSLWRSLVPDESHWIGEPKSRDAASDKYAVEQIIQDIWTITCRLASRIEKDQTAEPYNPYNIQSKSNGETFRDDDLPTDEPLT